MIRKEAILITCLISVVASHPCSCEEKSINFQEFDAKQRKCELQTGYLNGCCKYPHETDLKNIGCNSHFDRANASEGDQKLKASACYSDCLFKKEGLFKDNGEIDKEKLKEKVAEYVINKGAPEFKDISLSSLDFCFDQFSTNKEQWKKYYEYRNLTQSSGSDDTGPSCSMLPAGIMHCMLSNIGRNCPASKWETRENSNCAEFIAEATPVDECMKF